MSILYSTMVPVVYLEECKVSLPLRVGVYRRLLCVCMVFRGCTRCSRSMRLNDNTCNAVTAMLIAFHSLCDVVVRAHRGQLPVHWNDACCVLDSVLSKVAGRAY